LLHYAGVVAEHEEISTPARPLEVAGKAMVVFTLTAPTPDQMEKLEQELSRLTERLHAEFGTEINADRVAGRWEIYVDGVERASGGSFGPDNQLGALSAWLDNLTKVYPPETRTAVEQSIVDEHTAMIQEFAAAESAYDPVAARKAILARLERELGERVRRLTGEDLDHKDPDGDKGSGEPDGESRAP
jgi:hypothetical protein